MADHPTEVRHKYMDISNIFFLLKETQFVVDEVSNVIKEAIETTIGGNSYTVRIKRKRGG